MIGGLTKASALAAAAFHFAAAQANATGAPVPTLGALPARVFKVGFADLPYEPSGPALASAHEAVAARYLAMSRGRFAWDFTVDPDTLLAPRASRAYLGYGFDTLRAWIDRRLAAEGRLPSPPAIAVLHFPGIPAGFAGYASGYTVYMNGTYDADVLAHELGHSLGLAHARSLEPGGTRPSPLGGPATESEYGHAFDLMGIGRGPAAHFNARAKLRLGWLDSTEIAEGAGGGTFRLAAADGPASPHPRALRVPTGPGDSSLTYWIEYRTGGPGVLVQCTGYRDPKLSATPPAQTLWLLPAGSSPGQPLLLPGAITTDAATGLAFRLRSLSPESTWAEIEVIRPGTSVRTRPGASATVPKMKSDVLGRKVPRPNPVIHKAH